jgi:hypothetical protein
VDEDFNNLAPGACSWNPANFPDVPVEPGVVYFDLPKEAQPWSDTGKRLIDTTLNAAVHFPDMITLPRYLNDQSKYWLFYVDDKSNFSISYTATKHNAGNPVFKEFAGTDPLDQFKNIFGTAEKDLARARTHVSGIPSDDSTRSTSPADRRSDATKPPNRTQSSTSSVVGRTQRLEFVAVDRTPTGFSIRFRAGKNSSPQVRYSTNAPIDGATSSTSRLHFPDAGPYSFGREERIGGIKTDVTIAKPLPLGNGAEFVARSGGKPDRGTMYHFIITVLAENGVWEEQYTGKFWTMSQTVQVTLEAVKILQEPPGLNSYWSWALFPADKPEAAFQVYSGSHVAVLRNPSDLVRMIVGAVNAKDQSQQIYFGPQHWTVTPKPLMGIALIKYEFDTRSMTPGKRYPFSFTSSPGMDVVFYIKGYVEVSYK